MNAGVAPSKVALVIIVTIFAGKQNRTVQKFNTNNAHAPRTTPTRPMNASAAANTAGIRGAITQIAATVALIKAAVRARDLHVTLRTDFALDSTLEFEFGPDPAPGAGAHIRHALVRRQVGSSAVLGLLGVHREGAAEEGTISSGTGLGEVKARCGIADGIDIEVCINNGESGEAAI